MRPYLSLLPLLAICSLVLFVSACHKSKEQPDPPNLIGNWKLLSITGGIAGLLDTGPDSTYLLTLNSDSSFLRGYRNYPRGGGVFKTARMASMLSGEPDAPAILFITPTGTAYPQFYTLKRDSLWVRDDFADGYTSLYLRVRLNTGGEPF